MPNPRSSDTFVSQLGLTQSNWEGVGVISDVAAKPDDALAVARDLLQRRLDGSTPPAAAGQ
jgi:hypothetical protein